jgi:hypothetical protein
MECEQTLNAGDDREAVENGVLCRGCYDNLAAQVKEIVHQQDQDINYPMAVVGAVLGGLLGAIAWWGFTVITKIEFGLVAVVIGFTVAKGILMLTGGKRSQGLQIMAVVVSTISFFYANYLVSRTYIIAEYPEMKGSMGFLPDPLMFFDITRLTFGMFTIIFLGIVIWQAWQMVAPAKIK